MPERSALNTSQISEPPGMVAQSGETRSGMPLSLNRAAADDLDPWIARIVIAKVETTPDFKLDCGLCNDIAFERLLVGGEWTVETADGPRRFGSEPILLGPHSKHMPVVCRGTMSTLGVGFRPGALRKLLGRELPELVDRVEPGDPLGLLSDGGAARYAKDASAEEWASLVEERVRAFVERVQPDPPEPLSSAFEYASFANPNIAPGEFAESHGVSLRTLERTVRRDFGLPPRTVLRRARALDLAAQLLGISDETEEQEFLLRYFDQSHVIREFQAFFGVTPQAFRKSPKLLLTINLETRAARRLEELDRLRPGEKRPWHGGDAD
ncbi:helix-turn-helix domain-containing protein [uncultured Erythrobacter sp.]|uniref:helix-turn-helix domain-containing protein n=1 Tax=uncultured Erythrobacter sp. TaxID=263913 RepID=UPI00260BC7DB|nr:helix-turn-helix domain-containing protein [uncultured Erythrobacter sp.]